MTLTVTRRLQKIFLAGQKCWICWEFHNTRDSPDHKVQIIGVKPLKTMQTIPIYLLVNFNEVKLFSRKWNWTIHFTQTNIGEVKQSFLGYNISGETKVFWYRSFTSDSVQVDLIDHFYPNTNNYCTAHLLIGSQEILEIKRWKQSVYNVMVRLYCLTDITFSRKNNCDV